MADRGSQKRTLARRSLTHPDVPEGLASLVEQHQAPEGDQMSRRASAAHLQKRPTLDGLLGESGQEEEEPLAEDQSSPCPIVAPSTGSTSEKIGGASEQELAPSVRRMSLEDGKKEAAEAARLAKPVDADAGVGVATSITGSGPDCCASKAPSSVAQGAPLRPERRSSIDASIEAFAQQQQQLVPPRVISPQGGPSGSVNLVWQKRQDGGWAMGGNGVDLRPPNDFHPQGMPQGHYLGAQGAPTDVPAPGSFQPGCFNPPTTSVPFAAQVPSGPQTAMPLQAPMAHESKPPPLVPMSLSQHVPPSVAPALTAPFAEPSMSILNAVTLAPGAAPPDIARIPRRRVTVIRRAGAIPHLLVHSDNPSIPTTKAAFVPIDTTGDGQADALVADTSNDGRADALILDTSGDGMPDTAIPCVLVDTDGDGLGDILLVDTTDNGRADTILRIFKSGSGQGDPHAFGAPDPIPQTTPPYNNINQHMNPPLSAAAPGVASSAMGSNQPPQQLPARAHLPRDTLETAIAQTFDPENGADLSGPVAMAYPGEQAQRVVDTLGADKIDLASMGGGVRSSAKSFKGDGQLHKQGWTPEEDATILRMVQLTGQKWSFIACALPGRTDDAVRNRFLRLQKKKASGDVADAQATKRGDMWTAEEDSKIMHGVRVHGYKWQQIASVLPGRSANAVRNRFLRCNPENGASTTETYAQGDERASMAMHGGPAYMSGGPPEELVTQPQTAQSVNFFWDASALYGEALGAIHDDFFPQGPNS